MSEGGGEGRRGGESTNTLGVKIGKISDSLVLCLHLCSSLLLL